MGFSPYEAKKALLLSKMNIENATNYLLSNPDIDLPLTQKEIQYIYMSSKNMIEKPLKDPEIEEAQKLKICTFTTTGPDFKTQIWYQCIDCGLEDSKGCCEICAQICHKGHKLIPSKTGLPNSFFCDCGAGEGKYSCKCLDYEKLEKEREKERIEKEKEKIEKEKEKERLEQEKKLQSIQQLTQTIQNLTTQLKKEGNMISLNLQSKYNDVYTCSILGYEIVSNEFRVMIDVKGDQTLGDLQDPLKSRLFDQNGVALAPLSGHWTLVDPKYRYNGYLSFDLTKMKIGNTYTFQYGLSGYSKVLIFNYK